MQGDKGSIEAMNDGMQDDLVKTHRELLSLFERTYKYLDSVHADRSLLDAYKRLLRYLLNRPDETVYQILGNPSHSLSMPVREPALGLTDQEINCLTGERIQELASDPKLRRKDLERIAAIRFGVSKGALSSLRSRRALLDKLATLIGNEQTHESIGRAAGNEFRGEKVGQDRVAPTTKRNDPK